MKDKNVLCIGCSKETTESQCFEKEFGWFHFGCWQSKIWKLAKEAKGKTIIYGIWKARWINNACKTW